MSDSANPETPVSYEPQTAAPVVDARTNDAVSEPAPASAETQELIEPGVTPAPEPEAAAPATNEEVVGAPVESAAHEPVVPAEPEAPESAAPVAPVTTEDWSSVPEADFEAKKPAKKSRSRAKAAEPEEAEEPPAPGVSEEPAADAGESVATGVEEGGVPAEEAAEPPPPENKKKWYAIKVQSGREDTIKAAILRKVAIEGLEDVFGQIMVPVDKVIEKRAVKVKDKKTGEYTTVERKVERKVKKFQGYIFAELEFNDRLLYLIRETSGVGDFLKLRPRPNDTPLPEPMSDAEVKQMLGEKVGPEAGGTKKVKIEFEKGDRVRIKEGSFKDTEGDVKEVILPKDPTDPPKVMVTVTFWGRPLDVELEYWQVTKA